MSGCWSGFEFGFTLSMKWSLGAVENLSGLKWIQDCRKRVLGLFFDFLRVGRSHCDFEILLSLNFSTVEAVNRGWHSDRLEGDGKVLLINLDSI